MRAITVTIFILLSTLSASIIHVPRDQSSIQAGIDVATNGDTVLVQPGTYFENINYYGKNIVVGSLILTSGDTAYISQTVIDGGGYDSVVMFVNGEDSNAVITGFIITNGYGSNVQTNPNYSGKEGGGITCRDSSSPQLSNLLITNNTSYGGEGSGTGGGIYCNNNSNPILNNVIIRNNNSTSWWFTGFGGGLACSNNSNPRIINSVIENNSATNGGGIGCSNSNPEFISSRIIGNTARIGGGIYSTQFSNPHFSLSTVRNNTANDYGGGIYSSDSSSMVFDPISRSNIYNNYANLGHDLYISGYSNINVVLDTFTVNLPTDYYAFPAANLTFDIIHSLSKLTNADLYVSPSGNDQNNGLSFNEPLKTIGEAMAKIYVDNINRHKIILASGTYSQSSNDETYPLYWINFLSLSGDSADNIILDAEGVSHVIHCENINQVTFETFTVTNGLNWYGGGIYLDNSSPTLSKLIIKENTANFGGGIHCAYYSKPIIKDVLIINNIADGWGRGGGIYCRQYSSPILINVTISGNIAYESAATEWGGGGIYCQSFDSLIIINSILWDNSPNQIHLFSGNYANTVMVAYSDIEGGQNGIINTSGTLFWEDGNIEADPLFVDSDNEDFNLNENSPCIDGGRALFVWENDTLINIDPNDYEGNAPDMGAFESPYTVSISEEQILPVKFALYRNYPNPFNPVTTIRYDLPLQTEVKLSIYNVLGREVAVLFDESRIAGSHAVQWNASNASSGIYFYRLETPRKQITKKLVVLK